MPRGRPKGSKNRQPEAETETEKVKPQDVKEMISGGKLKRLMANKRRTANDIHEMAGTLGQEVKDAVENNHLHRKAFNTICMLDKMENEKIADYWDNLQYYLDVSGIQKRIESVMRMNLGEKTSTGEEDDEGESNVAQLHPAA